MRKLSLFIVLGLSCICFSCQEEEPPPLPSLYEHLSGNDVLSIELKTDLEELLQKSKEKKYIGGTLSWEGQSLDIQVSQRGNTRKVICDFPPLKLKFSSEGLKNMGLTPYSSLKLVSHCIEDDSYVLKEYLIYQLYEQLTEKSLKSQLILITYKDHKNRYPPLERFGILLENHHEMAQRIGGQLKKNDLKGINGNQYCLLTVFQYMIGNTDWNLSKRHNIKLVEHQEGPVPIPYDFDFSGLVNAPYAKPHPSLPIEDVKDRLFQWRGKNNNRLSQTLEHFRNKKAKLLEVVNGFEWLEEDHKDTVAKYLQSFFHTLDQVDGLDGEGIVGAFRKNDSTN